MPSAVTKIVGKFYNKGTGIVSKMHECYKDIY